MRTHRRLGFTLIELLVVIAIIGILAAMLFPVFARARESARKIQCLANVKNIAIAMQMYLTDWDLFFPREGSAGASAYFDSIPGPDGSDSQWWWDGFPHCKNSTYGNPYLRAPVLLDEYIKNRDVWRCPSAKVEKSAEVIIPMGPNGRWWENFIIHESVWTADVGLGPCQETWPTGWGAEVTDSLVQDRTAGVTGGQHVQGVFISGIGTNSGLWMDKPSAVNDVSKYVTFADFGVYYHIWDMAMSAYEVCRTTPCQEYQVKTGEGAAGSGACCIPDWTNCSWSRNCSADPVKFFTDSTYRKQFARHLGGINIGFLDGHAKWFSSEAIINGTCPVNPDSPLLEGVSCNWSPQCYPG